jgi:hypothetical protein
MIHDPPASRPTTSCSRRDVTITLGGLTEGGT